MKVLQQRAWEGTVQNCENCASRLLVEASDVQWNVDQDFFYVRCPICGDAIIFDDEEIPAHVRAAVRLQTNRPARLS